MRMLNDAMRYYHIVQFIKNNSPKKICEVGSGSDGLGRFLDVRFVGCDIEFPTRVNKNMVPVKADARKLPFPNKSFDLVFSLDTIEHIPARDRKKALKEMLRISKKHVILGFPCDDGARKVYMAVDNFYNLLRLKKPSWIKEHLSNRYPTSKDMHSMLSKLKCSYKLEPNANLLFHSIVIFAESLPLVFLITGLIGKFFIRMPKSIVRIFDMGQSYRKIF